MEMQDGDAVPEQGEESGVKTYKTLAELRDAYASGEITAPLVINHSADSEVWIPRDEDWVIVDTPFSMDTCQLLEEALDLLGVPHEHD